MKKYLQSHRFILTTIAIFTLWFTLSTLSLSKADPASAPCLTPTRGLVPTNTPSSATLAAMQSGTTLPCTTQTAVAPTATASTKKYSLLMAKANQQGKLRVIVQLNTPTQLEGLLNNAQITTQRSQIQSAKTVLLNMLSPFKTKRLATQWKIPYMALEVSPAALQYLSALPQVMSITEDRLNKVLDTPSNNLIDAPDAWALGYDGGGTPQTIAILDTGVQSNHPFLTGKVVAEACFSTNYSDANTTSTSFCPGGQESYIGLAAGAPCTLSGCEHGTHVAGIAAGVGGGSTGVTYSGVAKGANIIAIQVFSSIVNSTCTPTPCALTWTSDYISALDHVFSLRNSYTIASVNMSLGGDSYTDQALCDSQYAATKTAIDQLRSVGIATIVASGNDYSGVFISAPACISSAIAVGSVDFLDKVSYFSNSNFMVDLLAPGESDRDISGGIESSVAPSGYGVMAGTSMAAPHVAGAWAVLKQKYPNATFLEILALLQDTGAVVTDDFNGVTKARIDVDDALIPTCNSSALPKLVTISSNGNQSNALLSQPRMTGDGRYIVYQVDGNHNLVFNADHSSQTDILVHDRVTCQTMRIPFSRYNSLPNGSAMYPSISADGRYVAFTSNATDFVANDTSTNDVFVFDRVTLQIKRVSVSSTGVAGNGQSLNPSISADGRYVAFESDANNLVGTNTPNRDIFVHDRTTNQTILASRSGATLANGYNENAVISGNGNIVAFQSQATAFAANDTNGATRDIFIYNRITNTITMVSRSITGGSGNQESINPSISYDGRYVTFESAANNLVYGDIGTTKDIFVRDTVLNTTYIVSAANLSNTSFGNNTSQNAVISSNGDYVIFQSLASNLVAGDTNSVSDVFIRKFNTRQTIRVSLTDSGNQLTQGSDKPSIASTNMFVFNSSASNIVTGDTNGAADLFIGSFTFPPTPTKAPTSTRPPVSTKIPPVAPTLTHTPTPSNTPTPTVTPTPTNSYRSPYGLIP